MMVHRCLMLLVAASLLMGAISAVHADQSAQTAPTKPVVAAPKADMGAKAVQDAIAMLSKEYDAWRKDPNAGTASEAYKVFFGGPRRECNYFRENPSPDVTVKQILAALHRTLLPSASCDAYVKWQLLSGLNGKMDATQTADLLHLYSQIPQFPPHPGLVNKKAWDFMLKECKKGEDDSALVNGKVEQKRNEWRRDVDPHIQYRNALFGHLPATKAVLLAGLNDLKARIAAGIACQDFWTEFCGDIDLWAVDDGTSHNDLRQMAGNIRQLGLFGDDPRCQADDLAVFSTYAKPPQMQWQTNAMGTGTTDPIVKRLLQQANGADQKAQIRKDN